MKRGATNTSAVAKTLSLGAFVDLVGVRKLAAVDPPGYFQRLNLFHEAIGDASVKLKKSQDQVYFFSDCAYIVSTVRTDDESTTRLLDYMALLRKELFLRGVYFKAALGCYKLDPTNASSFPGKSDAIIRDRKELITGYYFGHESAELYRYHEEFKGIGIRVVPPSPSQLETMPESIRVLARRFFDRKKLVISCFVEATHRDAVEYLDIPFTEFSIDNAHNTIENILENLLLAKTQDDRFGPYYVSAIVTWVRSNNVVSNIEGDSFLEPESSTNIDPLLTAFCTGRLRRCFRNVAGYEQIFFAFVHNLVQHQSQLDESAKRFIWRRIASEDNLLQRLKRVPHDICGSDTRKQFVDAVNAALKNKQRGGK